MDIVRISKACDLLQEMSDSFKTRYTLHYFIPNSCEKSANYTLSYSFHSPFCFIQFHPLCNLIDLNHCHNRTLKTCLNLFSAII